MFACLAERERQPTVREDGGSSLRLIENFGLYRDEMAVFLYDESGILVSVSSIGRALASVKWTKKVTRRIASERNADLRDFYPHRSGTVKGRLGPLDHDNVAHQYA
jgi:hypothetical protein